MKDSSSLFLSSLKTFFTLRWPDFSRYFSIIPFSIWRKIQSFQQIFPLFKLFCISSRQKAFSKEISMCGLKSHVELHNLSYCCLFQTFQINPFLSVFTLKKEQTNSWAFDTIARYSDFNENLFPSGDFLLILEVSFSL